MAQNRSNDNSSEEEEELRYRAKKKKLLLSLERSIHTHSLHEQQLDDLLAWGLVYLTPLRLMRIKCNMKERKDRILLKRKAIQIMDDNRKQYLLGKKNIPISSSLPTVIVTPQPSTSRTVTSTASSSERIVYMSSPKCKRSVRPQTFHFNRPINKGKRIQMFIPFLNETKEEEGPSINQTINTNILGDETEKEKQEEDTPVNP